MIILQHLHEGDMRWTYMNDGLEVLLHPWVHVRLLQNPGESRFLEFALIWHGDLGHGPLMRGLPWLRLLERADHEEDDTAVLYGLDRTGRIRLAVAYPFNVVDDRCCRGGAEEEVALGCG